DVLVPLTRHAPKRHAALSFDVAHEGCGRRGPDCGDGGSGSGKRGFDGGGRKIGCTASPQSGDRTPPRISGTPKNHPDPANLDIGGPLPCTASAPRKAPQVVPN